MFQPVLQLIMGNGFGVVAAFAYHILGGDHCIDYGFLARLHHSPEQRIHVLVTEHFHLLQPGLARRITCTETDKNIPRAIAGD